MARTTLPPTSVHLHASLLLSDATAIPLTPLHSTEWKSWIKSQSPRIKQLAELHKFTAQEHSHLLITDNSGAVERVIVGIGTTYSFFSLSHLPTALPAGNYQLQPLTPIINNTLETLLTGWLLGGYRYTRYKKYDKKLPTLIVQPTDAAEAHIKHATYMADSIALVRDLVNAPANDMLPSQLEEAARSVAKAGKAKISVITGEALLKHNYPTIYTVGKASADAPRLIDMRWGNPSHPKVTLVGKGVCFDSGGLDIKPASGMFLMKKDMGGAACVLGLTQLIMAHKLPICLRVLVPAVENAISGNAFRPSDVITTRKGITVEVGDTDAEGRLILCDALAEADTESPDLLVDCATLTGAARVALGTDIPALFSNDDALAQSLMTHAKSQEDPLWQLPLWPGYTKLLKTYIADTSSTSSGSFGGAITAALFLQKFIENSPHWMHIDMMAWNASSSPGRPEGGEAMGLRALFALLKERYTPTA